MNTNYKRKRCTYSESKRAYLRGLLPPSEINNVHPSTLSSWKNKSLNNLNGYVLSMQNEQLDFYQLMERYDKLIKIIKAPALIVMCFSEIFCACSFRKKF